jgi:hypothetical protein
MSISSMAQYDLVLRHVEVVLAIKWLDPKIVQLNTGLWFDAGHEWSRRVT